MNRTLQLLVGLLTLALLSGCAGGGRVARARAEALAGWIETQSYSTWGTFKHERQEPKTPASPDGLTLGSPSVFAVIGCKPDDLTSLDVFWADQRTVRPFARPLAIAVRTTGGGEAVPLARFPDQTLRRVRHTTIAVSQSETEELRVSWVDFAPMKPEDSFLVRWFLVENTGKSRLRPSLAINMMASGEWTRPGARVWQRGDSLALVSDATLRSREDSVEVSMGRLLPGQRAAAALLLVAASDPARLPAHIACAESALPRLQELLQETKANWEAWCARAPLKSGDERTDDLLDSLLCLVRAHIGPEAIHTGSLRYPHNRAWVRDSYWVQRALLELGRTEEARLNLDFFHRAWRASGTASYYKIPSGAGVGYGYHGVELPHYLVLMVRDAERMAGVDSLEYWDMVRGCLDEAAVPPDGLQPMNGDETWLLAAPVRELDHLLDNLWLLIASMEYGADLANRAGDGEGADRYRELAARGRGALQQFTPNGYQPQWYAVGLGGDGSLDFSLCPEVFARGAILGVLPPSGGWLTNGLVFSWEQLNFERGIRTHSRSATISGGTPGYVLYAAADSEICDSLFNRELARRMLRFASATGCVWEYHDLHDPAWGGEKRRLWDSAVLLMGMVHALFDREQRDGQTAFVAKGPPAAIRFERPAPPLLNAQAATALVEACGPALILHERSPQHAARIARELLRQRQQQYAIAPYPGTPPSDRSAIIVSPAPPPSGWRSAHTGYWLREWSGPPQVWVVSKGNVYRDTEPLLRELLAALTPQRAKPLPYPDANYELVSHCGEMPSGKAEVLAVSALRRATGSLSLAGGRVSLKLGEMEFAAKAAADRERRLLQLTVSAAAPRPEPAELTVTLPPGWWVVYARDMTGRWDRVNDPVCEIRLPDGRLRLVYSFHPGLDALYLTFDLARLAVAHR